MGTNAKFGQTLGNIKETIQLGYNTFSEDEIANATGDDVILEVGAIMARKADGSLVVFDATKTDNEGIIVGFNTDARTIPANGDAIVKIVTGGKIDANVVKFASNVDWDTQVTLEDQASPAVGVITRTIKELVEARGFEIEFGKVLDA